MSCATPSWPPSSPVSCPRNVSPRPPSASVNSPPGRWPPAAPASAGARGAADVGLVAARRAVRVTAAPGTTVALPLTRAAHVVEFEPLRNIAIGAETPWGIGGPLAELLPGTSTVRYAEPDVPADPGAGADGRPLVLVVRDLHRHDWMRAAVHRALAVRPDAVVVELGVPELVTGAVHLATHGATRASGRAAAEVLTGAR